MDTLSDSGSCRDVPESVSSSSANSDAAAKPAAKRKRCVLDDEVHVRATLGHRCKCARVNCYEQFSEPKVFEQLFGSLELLLFGAKSSCWRCGLEIVSMCTPVDNGELPFPFDKGIRLQEEDGTLTLKLGIDIDIIPISHGCFEFFWYQFESRVMCCQDSLLM